MGWENVDLSGVNPNFELVAKGEYTFQVLPGAKIDDYKRLDFPVNVVSDGDFKGRRLFLNLPDPTSEGGTWAPRHLKRLEQAVGIEQDKDANETVVAWMNRLGENFARFSAPLDHRTFKNKAGDDVTVEKVKLDKARPAA